MRVYSPSLWRVLPRSLAHVYFRPADRAFFSDLPEGFPFTDLQIIPPRLSDLQLAFSFRPANRLPFPTCSFSPPSFRLAYGVFFQTCQPAGLLLDVRGFSPSLSGARSCLFLSGLSPSRSPSRPADHSASIFSFRLADRVFFSDLPANILLFPTCSFSPSLPPPFLLLRHPLSTPSRSLLLPRQGVPLE